MHLDRVGDTKGKILAYRDRLRLMPVFMEKCEKSVVVSGLLGLLEFGLISSVLGPPGREAIKVCFALVVGHMAMAAVMIGVLFFLRFF